MVTSMTYFRESCNAHRKTFKWTWQANKVKRRMIILSNIREENKDYITLVSVFTGVWF